MVHGAQSDWSFPRVPHCDQVPVVSPCPVPWPLPSTLPIPCGTWFSCPGDLPALRVASVPVPVPQCRDVGGREGSELEAAGWILLQRRRGLGLLLFWFGRCEVQAPDAGRWWLPSKGSLVRTSQDSRGGEGSLDAWGLLMDKDKVSAFRERAPGMDWRRRGLALGVERRRGTVPGHKCQVFNQKFC